MNLFRGNEYYLENKGEIRIPFENRDSVFSNAWIRIVITPEFKDLHALIYPEGERVNIEEFDYKIARFVKDLAEKARQKKYLQSSSKHANYRNNFK